MVIVTLNRHGVSEGIEPKDHMEAGIDISARLTQEIVLVKQPQQAQPRGKNKNHIFTCHSRKKLSRRHDRRFGTYQNIVETSTSRMRSE